LRKYFLAVGSVRFLEEKEPER